MPEIKAMLPPKLPEPFEGRLFQSYGRMIGEYEDVIAFPYRSYEDYRNYLHVITNGKGKSFLLPDSTDMNTASVSAVMTAKDEIWIAFGLPITVNQYHIGSDAITLISSTTLGDSKSRLKDLIKLDNGKLFVAWHQFERGKVDAEGNPGIDVGFAYKTVDGKWHTLPYTWVYPFTLPATQGAVCQHPADGSIWFFCQPDGCGTICVIHLVESGEEISVDWTDYNFLNKYDAEMAPEGELPFFSAVADKQRNAIILAYQSNDWQMFSLDPFCKGAKPAIIQVNSDASKSLLFVLSKRLERVNPLYVGLNDQGEVWLAYGRIDEVNLTWNDLYISTENKDQCCGKMQYGIPGNQGVRLCSSSKLVVATMDDGHIHFYGIQGERVMQIVVDVSSWTQTEKNYLQAAAVALLWQMGITYDNILVKNGVIDISNPSADVSLVLTESNLKAFIVVELEKSRIATEEALVEAGIRDQEIRTSEFRDIKLADIDSKIDAIENLVQLKVALKKLARFLIARV